jgi:hypothetical protein
MMALMASPSWIRRENLSGRLDGLLCQGGLKWKQCNENEVIVGVVAKPYSQSFYTDWQFQIATIWD